MPADRDASEVIFDAIRPLAPSAKRASAMAGAAVAALVDAGYAAGTAEIVKTALQPLIKELSDEWHDRNTVYRSTLGRHEDPETLRSRALAEAERDLIDRHANRLRQIAGALMRDLSSALPEQSP